MYVRLFVNKSDSKNIMSLFFIFIYVYSRCAAWRLRPPVHFLWSVPWHAHHHSLFAIQVIPVGCTRLGPRGAPPLALCGVAPVGGPWFIVRLCPFTDTRHSCLHVWGDMLLGSRAGFPHGAPHQAPVSPSWLHVGLVIELTVMRGFSGTHVGPLYPTFGSLLRVIGV